MRSPVRSALLVAAAGLFLAAYLVVRFDAPGASPAVSTLFLVALALPSYTAVVRWLGPARGIALLLVLSLIPLAVEAYAVATGMPYGAFAYSPHLGDRLFDLVPWTVAFAFLPMLLGAVAIGSALVGTGWRRFIPASVFFLLLVDLVIDPAAVHAGLWLWAEDGAYYGVPLSNFAGWVLTGTVYVALVYYIARRDLVAGRPVPGLVASSLLLIVAFWTGYLVRNGLILPSLLGGALFVAACAVAFRDG